ncbi:hypothetical protein LXL04_028725 [Taraxacum kok-saghyz]
MNKGIQDYGYIPPHRVTGGVFTWQAPGSANAIVLLILIPSAAIVLPSRAVQRHCGCDVTTFSRDEQQEEDGVLEFPCGSDKDNLESCISVYNHAFAFPLSVAIPATSDKDNLESCISVYNHAFAFPLSVAIPATKRGNGGVSTKLSG